MMGIEVVSGLGVGINTQDAVGGSKRGGEASGRGEGVEKNLCKGRGKQGSRTRRVEHTTRYAPGTCRERDASDT